MFSEMTEAGHATAGVIGLLRSIQVGAPQIYGADGGVIEREAARGAWTTSFFRVPAAGSRWLYRTHLEGNVQADRKNHGHPDQAVLVYAAAHYPMWQAELGRADITDGGFGENFTVEGLSEETVCLADVYAVGKARIAVSGPRYPCVKIERRWNSPGLTARVAASGRTDWYCFVHEEGRVEAGIPLTLLHRPYPEWTVARMNDILHRRETNPDVVQAFLASPCLDEGLRAFTISCVRGAV